MSQHDLFASYLSETDQKHIDEIVLAMRDGRLHDAQIEASLGASDSVSGDVRERFDLVAQSLWHAKRWVDAWKVIECQRRWA